MKGSHRIIVESRKVKYDFVIHRNITVITGDSGSGKTVLIDLIHDYGRYGADSGVFLSCDCPCKVIDSEDWERQIEETTGSIIFIDEGNRFLISKKFAQLVQGSDNYFVLATREKLPALPYSVNEVYGFRKSGKFHDAKQKYNEIYHLYGEISEEKNINPKLVITEDSNSGFEFFNEMSRQKGVNCFSAGGKSNIIRQLEQSQNEEGTILVIVDGAAFGSEMKDISECIVFFAINIVCKTVTSVLTDTFNRVKTFNDRIIFLNIRVPVPRFAKLNRLNLYSVLLGVSSYITSLLDITIKSV